MQRHRLSDRPQTTLKRIKSGVQLIKALPHWIFGRGTRIQKALKRCLHDHVLAHTRSFGCGLKLFMEPFGKTYSYLASC